MRTTVDIDEDILRVIKALARERGISMGRVLSDLIREALTRPAVLETRNGVPLFPRQPGAGIVTLDLVNELRDETP